jgi:hypothetical protein
MGQRTGRRRCFRRARCRCKRDKRGKVDGRTGNKSRKQQGLRSRRLNHWRYRQ